ncbi:hypothetical protein OKW35_000583 [Paraburkholderia sp. MM5477-R1]
MKLDSHLLDTAPAGVTSCEGAVEAHVDAAIIGGAFTGLTAPLARGSRGMQKATVSCSRTWRRCFRALATRVATIAGRCRRQDG